MELNIARARRDEHTVALEELKHGVAAEHRAASVEEQEYLERFRGDMERRQFAALFRIHQHAFHMKVLAAAEQFRSGPARIPQQTHRLARFRHGFEIRDCKPFFEVKRTFVSVTVDTVVIVQTVGKI